VKLFGASDQKDLIGRPYLDLVHPDDRAGSKERIKKMLEEGLVVPFREHRLVALDARVINVESTGTTFKHQDKIMIQTIIHDISDRKKAEEEKARLASQLLQAQKMEAIGTLAGGIAHDFNNLLMGIQGHTSLMLMDVDSSHPMVEHLNEIKNHVKSSVNLTKQLLGFARGGKYETRTTDLNELVKNQTRMFQRTRKEITIYENYEKNLWAVDVDRGQIEQAFLNLYVNAWQAMPGGGDLTVKTENIIIDENYDAHFEVKPGKYLKISVIDTGVGMDETTRQRIFEPFFTTREMGRGTGLGMASVYGIIKNHNGFINVYSELGEGTTFTVYLPASLKTVAGRWPRDDSSCR